MHDSSSGNGWQRHRFDEMALMVNDRIDDPADADVEYYVGLEHLDSDSLTIRRWGSPSDVEATKLRFRTGDIIFGRRRVYQRKLAVANFDGICSAHAIVLRAKPKVVLPEFLPFFMQSDLFMERAKEISVGSLSPTINWKTLALEEFALPPLDEQRQMAEVLGAATAATDSLSFLRDCAVTAEHSLLRYTFGTAPGASPPGLQVVRLSELAEIRTGLAKGRQADSSTTTRPYLRVANVKDGWLDLTELKEIVVEVSRIGRYSLRFGDVLMTEGGDLDKLGRGTVWQDEVPDCLHQNHVFVIRTNRVRLDPWYLAAVARSQYGRSYFLSCAKRTSNLASINKRQVGEFPIPLLDTAAQERWVSLYRLLRDAVIQVEERLVNATTTRKRLFARLMGNNP